MTTLKHPMSLEHYSPTENLTEVDPAFQGSGAVGKERQRPNRIPRSYFYFAGTPPEPEVVGICRAKYKAVLPPGTKLYDFSKDELGLMEPKWIDTKHGKLYDPPDIDEVEREIESRGYHGYHSYNSTVPGGVALFKKIKVQQIPMSDKEKLKKVEPLLTAEEQTEKLKKLFDTAHTRGWEADEWETPAAMVKATERGEPTVLNQLLWACACPQLSKEQQREILGVENKYRIASPTIFSVLLRNPALDHDILKEFIVKTKTVAGADREVVVPPPLWDSKAFAPAFYRSLLSHGGKNALDKMGIGISQKTLGKMMYQSSYNDLTGMMTIRDQTASLTASLDEAQNLEEMFNLPVRALTATGGDTWTRKALDFALAGTDEAKKKADFSDIVERTMDALPGDYAGQGVGGKIIEAARSNKFALPYDFIAAAAATGVFNSDQMDYLFEAVDPETDDYDRRHLQQKILSSPGATPAMMKRVLDPTNLPSMFSAEDEAVDFFRRCSGNWLKDPEVINKLIKDVAIAKPDYVRSICSGIAAAGSLKIRAAYGEITKASAQSGLALMKLALAHPGTPETEDANRAFAINHVFEYYGEDAFTAFSNEDLGDMLVNTLFSGKISSGESGRMGELLSNAMGTVSSADSRNLSVKLLSGHLDRKVGTEGLPYRLLTRIFRGINGTYSDPEKSVGWARKIAASNDSETMSAFASSGRGFESLPDNEWSALFNKAISAGAGLVSPLIENHTKELSPEDTRAALEMEADDSVLDSVRSNLMGHDPGYGSEDEVRSPATMSPSMRILCNYYEKNPTKPVDAYFLKHLPMETLKALAPHHPDTANYLGRIDPDLAAKYKVSVKLGTTKARKFRDLVMKAHLEKRGASILPEDREKPEGMWAMPKEVPNWSKLIEVGRAPNGTVSAGKLQSWIDAQPETNYNVTEGTWNASQRHNDEPSNVFQLNMTKATLDKLKTETPEVYKTWKKIYDKYKRNGHPAGPFGVGWVRWTGDKDRGVFIDEVQSDIGQSMVRQEEGVLHQRYLDSTMQSWYKERVDNWLEQLSAPEAPKDLSGWSPNPNDAKYLSSNGVAGPWAANWAVAGMSRRLTVPKSLAEGFYSGTIKSFDDLTPEFWSKEVEANPDYQGDLERLRRDYPEAHLEHLQKVLFGGQHSNVMLHEAFQQWLRDQGWHGTKVAVHSVYSKAPKSGWDLSKVVKRVTKKKDKKTGEEKEVINYQLSLPGHARVTYDQHPSDMGMEPAVYGNLPSQSGPNKQMTIYSVDANTGKTDSKVVPTPIFQSEVHKSEDDWTTLLPEIVLE